MIHVFDKIDLSSKYLSLATTETYRFAIEKKKPGFEKPGLGWGRR